MINKTWYSSTATGNNAVVGAPLLVEGDNRSVGYANADAVPLPNAPTMGEDKVVVVSNATPVGWSGAVQASSVAIPHATPIVGGHAIVSDTYGVPYERQSEKLAPSFDVLLNELKASINDLDIIRNNLDQPEWKPLFASLSPLQFSKIIMEVDLEFHKSEVATLTAGAIQNFSCDHCIAAIRVATDFVRSNMLEKLLPLCVDLRTGQGKIKAELTDWEVLTSQNCFSKALAS